MKNRLMISILIAVMIPLIFNNCKNTTENQIQYPQEKDKVFQYWLKSLRLGDGVPLNIFVHLRWKVQDPDMFYTQFATADTFQNLILLPRSSEITKSLANRYLSVDSVFLGQKQQFLDDIKLALFNKLGEDGIEIKEVTITDLNFPTSYTDAMEKAGLMRQELERIEQQKIIKLAEAEADRKKTEAKALVKIAEAEAEARIQKIKTKTEESHRSSELAKAETLAQIARKNAGVEADKKRLMAKVEVEKQRDLKNLEVEKRRELDRVDFENQLELAKIYQEYPIYATTVVNKELASKVNIAVLPNTGTDSNVFGNLFKQTLPQIKN